MLVHGHCIPWLPREINSYKAQPAFLDPYKKGWEMAIEEINAKGGVLGRKIELIIRDSKADANEAVRVAREMILKDNVDFLMGTLTSAEGPAVSVVAKENKIVFIAPIPKTDQLTAADKLHPYVFRIAANTTMEGRSAAEIVAKWPVTKVATIAFDYAYGQDVTKAFVEHMKKIKPSVQIVDQQWPKLGEADYTPFINAQLAKKPEAVVGTGPWMLERYEPGVKAVFARNPTYYETGLPHLDKVEWLFLKDRSTQLSLFRAGQVDVPSYDGRIPRSDADSFKKARPEYPVVYWDGLAVRTLAMRTDRPPFNDVRVRRAFSLAVDRRKWVSQYLEGQGHEDQGPVPSAMREWKLSPRHLREGARYLEHDPALARKLLAEAGVPGGLRVKCTLAGLRLGVHGRPRPPGPRTETDRSGAADRPRGLRAVHPRIISREVRRGQLGSIAPPHRGRRLPLRLLSRWVARQPEPRGGYPARRAAGGPAPVQLEVVAEEGHRRHPAPRRRARVLRVYPVPEERVGLDAAGQELRPEELLRPGCPARGGLDRQVTGGGRALGPALHVALSRASSSPRLTVFGGPLSRAVHPPTNWGVPSLFPESRDHDFSPQVRADR